jgi:carbon monoxide dehydrogenase subunit G
MQFTNEFTVAAAADTVFEAMLDVRGVAGCMPGATIGEQTEDGSLEATVAVRVGPIRLTYGGTVRVEDADRAARTARMRVVAREQRGQGGAEATVSLAMAEAGGGSRATMVTDLAVTGRVAQMGAGVMQEVANSMVAQFADCLSAKLAERQPEPEAQPAPAEGAPAPARAGELRPLPMVLRAVGSRIKRLFKL